MLFKRILASLAIFAVLATPAFAGIDDTINSITAPIASLVGQIVFFKVPVFGAQLPLVVLWLVIGAVFFTLYLGFANVRYFKRAFKMVFFEKSDQEKKEGHISSFQVKQ